MTIASAKDSAPVCTAGRPGGAEKLASVTQNPGLIARTETTVSTGASEATAGKPGWRPGDPGKPGHRIQRLQ
jgi:hypothetical protein